MDVSRHMDDLSFFFEDLRGFFLQLFLACCSKRFSVVLDFRDKGSQTGVRLARRTLVVQMTDLASPVSQRAGQVSDMQRTDH
jgi:hypothetical protein